jgi:tetratricopeptide (TPR) repeat protein
MLSRAEACNMKATAIMTEKGFLHVQKAARWLKNCRALLDELLSEPASGPAASGPDDEGSCAIRAAQSALAKCQKKLEEASSARQPDGAIESPLQQLLSAQAKNQALADANAALETCQRLHRITNVIANWNLIQGDIDSEQALYLKAAVSYKRAIDVFEALQDWQAYARALQRSAMVECTLGNHDEASKQLERARSVLDEQLKMHVCKYCRVQRAEVQRHTLYARKPSGEARRSVSIPGLLAFPTSMPPLPQTSVSGGAGGSGGGKEAGGLEAGATIKATCHFEERTHRQVAKVKIGLVSLLPPGRAHANVLMI